MKRSLLFLLEVVLFGAFASAQSPYSVLSSTTGNPQSDPLSSFGQSSPSSTPQSSNSSGSDMSHNSTVGSGKMFDGCIVKQKNNYYLQPIKGGRRVKLTSSEDLSAHLGHHVHLQGAPDNGSSRGSAATSTVLNVTHVDMIATTCQDSTNSPK